MQAEVLSLDSLDDLDRALATFSSQAADALTTMAAQFHRRRADLDSQEKDARAEVDHWVERLELAEDEDECESCMSSLSVARERLSISRYWQAKVREEHASFLTQVALFKRLLDQTLPRGRDLLRTRTGELRAYGAVQLEPGESAAGGSFSGTVLPTPGEASPSNPAKLTEHRLPDGFVWVSLTEISTAGLAGVASKDDYKKVAYDTMATGLRRLAAEILPQINANPDALDRDSFRHLDEMAGESYEEGLQRIYEAFFCKDFVYLERRRGQEKFDITNGRHRIQVALDLGWDAIPARVKDLR